ncbi:UDP-glycosyltransferase 73c4 [Phtheirospermum japonicum]|uniref:Glycosyltransferase n=1 Tax=Phtheirospermum japonicum TaxID=374723 RepID=A0A830BD72_9LAMI|nr:UDP-glycosyltransferase 73c4 [Phtheirospermum japonicum]
MTPSFDCWLKFVNATFMLEDQVEQILQNLNPSPSCLISDLLYPWTANVAAKFGIPRLMFYGTSCFYLLCLHMLGISMGFKDIAASETEYFVVPDFPDRIEITKAQIKGTPSEVSPEWAKLGIQLEEAYTQSFGMVINTFEELEPEYIREYGKKKGKKVWCVGPVSLCNEDELDKAERGEKASIGEYECLKWLDLQISSSVIYVCLGTLSSVATSQLIELGLGLEASNCPFIWVIRNASDEFKKWLLEEKFELDEARFEEMISKRGLLIYGWAPQVLILSHPSVGGFLTHCGWNSTLEGITAGLPMMTWPVFAEQFCNEKFIVNVIKTGIRVGVEVPVSFGEEENVGVQVKSGDIKTVIEKLMDGGEEGEERRERARKLGKLAKSAPDEGGSSYLNLTRLIQDVSPGRKLCVEANQEIMGSQNH